MFRRAVAVAMATIVVVGALASYAQAEETTVKVEPGLDQTTFEIPVDVCGELCGEDASEACPVYRPMEHAELPGAVEDVPCRYNLEVKNRKLGMVFSKEGMANSVKPLCLGTNLATTGTPAG
jgi:hypothetical protein